MHEPTGREKRNMKKYAIVQKTDDIIMCHGVYPYYEAIGHLVVLADESRKSWEDNDYKLADSKSFFRLEADSGYGWYWHYCDKISIDELYEYWYILEVFEDG